MDETDCAKSLEPLIARWRAFGWAAREIDGHEMSSICKALDWATGVTGKPTVIIARTVKGRGVPFLENEPQFHNAALSREQYELSIEHLESRVSALEEAQDAC
jgi:transketolase